MLLQPNVEQLDKAVNELKKVMMDAKLKAKEPNSVMGATPPTGSRNVTPDKATNFSPPIRPDVRRLKSDDEKSDSSFGCVAIRFFMFCCVDLIIVGLVWLRHSLTYADSWF